MGGVVNELAPKTYEDHRAIQMAHTTYNMFFFYIACLMFLIRKNQRRWNRTIIWALTFFNNGVIKKRHVSVTTSMVLINTKTKYLFETTKDTSDLWPDVCECRFTTLWFRWPMNFMDKAEAGKNICNVVQTPDCGCKNKQSNYLLFQLIE